MSATTGWATERPLEVPDLAYNSDGIAPLLLTGTSYGEMWRIGAIHNSNGKSMALGAVRTGRTSDPEVAAATALEWVRAECARLGLKVAHYVNCSDQYGPKERPFFTAAKVLVVDKDWS